MAWKVNMTDSGDPTLCMPDKSKSCFACCPPIRPKGYEHLSYRNILKRIFRENTFDFDPGHRKMLPIRGYNCWGLGYLDPQYRLIGCLLHPARNNGVDLRFRIDYWDKCRRESCPESRTFSLMHPSARKFWLQLSEGLDSFAYSSRKENPLFSLLGWGEPVLSMIAGEEGNKTLTRESFVGEYPFFESAVAPKGNAYLLRRLLASWGIQWLKDGEFRSSFEDFSKEIADSLRPISGAVANGAPSHLLHLEQDFSDFLRIHLRIARIELQEALLIKREVDDRIDSFKVA